MNSDELIKAVNFLESDKGLERDLIFSSIEKGIRLAIIKKYGIDPDSDDARQVLVTVERNKGNVKAQMLVRNEAGVASIKVLAPEELGRIAAQSAKQQMIQSFREAESDDVFERFKPRIGDLVTGQVKRIDRHVATVVLDNDRNVEAIMPLTEQIRGETHHENERIKAVLLEVKKVGNRVKIVLSRTHPDFVRRLFEEEIPEVADHTIEIRAVAREAGNRAKVAVSSIDQKVDPVGACVGMKGSRIKNIVEELNGERIDIVRWNDSLQVLIPNALQPAGIAEVQLYPRLGRAIVLVQEDQLSLAIGKRGQNVRLASKLVGWDIEIMTYDELNRSLDKSQLLFQHIPGLPDSLIESIITEGFFDYEDLGYSMDPAEIVELSEDTLTMEEADEIIAFAKERSDDIEFIVENLEGVTVNETDVYLFPRLKRALVQVRENQLADAESQKDRLTRITGRLPGWEAVITTRDGYDQALQKARHWFPQVPGLDETLPGLLLAEGFLTYRDLRSIDPDYLISLSGNSLTQEDAESAMQYVTEWADEMDQSVWQPLQEEEVPEEEAEISQPDSESPMSFDGLFSGEEPTAPSETPEEVVSDAPAADQPEA